MHGPGIVSHWGATTVEIYINDNPLGVVDFPEQTLGDALRQLQSEHCPSGQVIVGVRHNGVDIPGGEMDAELARPAREFEKIDLITAEPDRLVAEALGQAEEVLDEADAMRKATAEHFIAGRIEEAKQSLVEDLRAWQQIHEAITQSIRMLGLESDKLTIQGRPMLELLEKPRELLMQVKVSLADEDYVMLADILKYEFEDVIGPWREMIEMLHARADEHQPQVT